MPRRRRDDHQPSLFGPDFDPPKPDRPDPAAVEPQPPDPAVQSLAARLPRGIYLGTSSWTFPGWDGLLYRGTPTQSKLARAGLSAYAAHPLLRTVGLDRAFYQPLSRDEYRRLADQTPPGFRFLVKAHQAITRPDADASGRTFGDTARLRESGAPNPLFLDPAYAADAVIGPAVSGLATRLGPIVFQFPPLDLRPRGPFDGPLALIDRLDAFLAKLPGRDDLAAVGGFIAVEFRNRQLFEGPAARAYASLLLTHGIAHGYAGHPALPLMAHQFHALAEHDAGPENGPGLCLRWLLHPTLGYEEARLRYQPFNRLIDEDPPARAEVAALARRVLAGGGDAWIIANNKAEGSAPLTLVRLAEALAD
ncbi:MAG: DUF72 domain-containing protein [Phycisphaerales bacterium]|nr:DUF72 domain-containing protein [Phycisphaerales bacterium]